MPKTINFEPKEPIKREPEKQQTVDAPQIENKPELSKREAKKAAKRAKKANRSIGRKILGFFVKLILIILLLSLLAAAGVGVLVYFGIVDVPVVAELMETVGIKEAPVDEAGNDFNEDEITLENYLEEYPDVEGYFQENSQIKNKVEVKNSKDTMTEKQVVEFLQERGFTAYPITTEYDMEGNYSNAVEVSNSSTEKHPIYQTYYRSLTDEIWSIMVIDGDIVASPLSYNMQSSSGVQLVLAESDEVTSYDSQANIYYKTVPDETIMNVKVVPQIDSATLDKLIDPSEAEKLTAPSPYDYSQKLTVTTPVSGSSYGTATLYEWIEGDWKEISKYSCSVGKNGIGPAKEGSQTTPEGIHHLGVVLSASTVNTNMQTYKATSKTGVVDDVKSQLYNQIMEKGQVPSGVSFDNIGEGLTNGSTYATIFIEHNGNGFSSDNVVSGNGSAIGVRGRKGSLSPTYGDVDISIDDMKDLLTRLDVNKNPMIEIKAD